MWGTLISWLSKLDPNVVVPVVVSVGGWLYHKIAGERAKTIEQIVSGAVNAILSEIADSVPESVPIETWLKGARVYVQDRIWKALAKVKVAKSPALEKIVSSALENATSTLAQRIADERRKKSHTNGVIPHTQ